MGGSEAHRPGRDGSRTLTGLIKRSFSLAGHRTSVALEMEFWRVLLEAAQSRGASLAALVAEIDAMRDGATPLASALRIFALREAQAPASGSSINIASR